MKRRDAILQQITRYTSDKPCKNCSNFERYTANGACIFCMRFKKPVISDCKQILAQLPTTRADAIRLKSKFYRPPERCRHGHLSTRFTSNAACVQCNRIAAARARGGYAAACRAAGYIEVLGVMVPSSLVDAVRDTIYWQVEAWRLTQPVRPPVLPPPPDKPVAEANPLR